MLLKIIPLSLAPKNNKICNHESEKLAHSNLGNISARFKESAIGDGGVPCSGTGRLYFAKISVSPRAT